MNDQSTIFFHCVTGRRRSAVARPRGRHVRATSIALGECGFGGVGASADCEAIVRSAMLGCSALLSDVFNPSVCFGHR